MASIRINTPDGRTVMLQAPDNASPEQIQSKLAEIKSRLSSESKPFEDPVGEIIPQAVYGFNRGLANIINLPGNLVSGAARLAGYDIGKPESALTRFLESGPAPQTSAGRVASAVGESVAGAAPVTAGMMTAARAAQTAGRAAPALLAPYAQAPGSAVAMDAASAVGAGIGSGIGQEVGGTTGQVVGGLLGGLAPAGISIATQQPRQMIARARANQGEQGAYGQFVEDIGPQNLDDFANQIATGGTNRNVQVQRRTLDILGEEMQRAGGNVQRAQQATVNRIAQEYGITTQQAAQNIRALSQVHEGSPLMLAEYPAVAQSNAATRNPQNTQFTLDDVNRSVDTTTQGTLDYLANNGQSASAVATRNAILRRQEELAPTMTATLDAVAPQVGIVNPGAPVGRGNPGRAATIQDAATIVDQATQAGSAAYRAAHSSPVNNRILTIGLPRLLQWYENRIAGRAGEAAQAMRRALNEFYIDTPNGRVAMMTLQQLQDARGAVRGMITRAVREGDDNTVNALQPFYTRITRMMEAASPQWAQANRQWSDMNFLRMGQELGDAFATRAGPRFREQLEEFRNLAPEAQNLVRIHFLQQLRDKLDNLGDTHSISKLFASDHSRRAIELLFGRQDAIAFTRAVRDQRVAETTQKALSNSFTHRRMQAQKQRDADTGLVAAVNSANARGLRDWLLEKTTQLLTERKNRPMADIYTTPVSDTAQVARHLYNARQQQQRLQQLAQPQIRTNPLPAVAAGSFSSQTTDPRNGR